jgi:hypothetical protein
VNAVFDGVRFPRSMLANEASERLLRFLGVTIVDDCDAELEDYARAWLVDVEHVNPPRHGYVPAAAVRRALQRIDERRAA